MNIGDFALGLVGNFVAAAAGYYYAKSTLRRQDRAQWTNHEFPDTLNVSLNLVGPLRDGRRSLHIRTIIEKPIDRLFPSTAVQNYIRQSACATTAQSPVLHFRKDQWHLNNEIVNLISKSLASGYVAQALGMPVVTKRFVFGLVYERTDTLRIRRLRCMLIEEQLLTHEVLDQISGGSAFEQAHHEARVETLRSILAARDLSQDESAVGTIFLTSAAALPADQDGLHAGLLGGLPQ